MESKKDFDVEWGYVRPVDLRPFPLKEPHVIGAGLKVAPTNPPKKSPAKENKLFYLPQFSELSCAGYLSSQGFK